MVTIQVFTAAVSFACVTKVAELIFFAVLNGWYSSYDSSGVETAPQSSSLIPILSDSFFLISSCFHGKTA